MDKVGYSLELVGVMVAGIGTFRVWNRASSGAPGRWWVRTGTRWGQLRRFVSNRGRPIHLTGGAQLDIGVTPTAGGKTSRGGTTDDRLRRLDQNVEDRLADLYAENKANKTAVSVMVAALLAEHQADENAKVVTDTYITAAGLVITAAERRFRRNPDRLLWYLQGVCTATGTATRSKNAPADGNPLIWGDAKQKLHSSALLNASDQLDELA